MACHVQHYKVSAPGNVHDNKPQYEESCSMGRDAHVLCQLLASKEQCLETWKGALESTVAHAACSACHSVKLGEAMSAQVPNAHWMTLVGT